jgi:ribosomal-protein-alanine acetyltransferase
MTLTVANASIRHLDRLYEIETECFAEERFTKKQIAQLLTDYNSISLIARIDSEIVGFVVGRVYIDRNALNGHILTLDVSSKSRRKGIGQKLLKEIERIFKEEGAKACHLEVREENVAAISLYLKFGYKKIGRLKNYYGNAHGIYLKKVLT